MPPLSIACSSLKGSISTKDGNASRSPSPINASASTISRAEYHEEYEEYTYFSMMNVKVHKMRLNNPLFKCYFKIRIGDEFYMHEPLHSLESDPHEFVFKKSSYNFDVSFHSQLFDCLQIDILEPRRCKRDVRIGRMLLRLSHLHGLPSVFTSWFEILELEDATQELLGSRNFSHISIQSIGAIELTIRYKYQNLAHLTQSISSFTLKSTSSRKGSFPNLFTTHSHPEDGDEKAITEETMGEHGHIQESQTKYLCWVRFLSHFMDEETFVSVMSIQKLFFAFGQGLNLSRGVFVLAVKLLSKFYAKIPVKRAGKFVIDPGFVQHISRIFQYSIAAFGWVGLNYTGHGKGVLYDVFRPHADRKCILEFLSIPPDDLLELELEHDELFRPSYFIAVDVQLEAIILSIRGSMSAIDTITDLACHYQPWQGGMVHSGIYTAARWIMENVMNRVILYKEQRNMKRVILTGHSLGAAISAVVGMMIREKGLQSPTMSPVHYRNLSGSLLTGDMGAPNIPLYNPFFNERENVFSYCYGCPALISAELVPLSEINTFTFNYGNDLVPRLSYGSLMDFRIMLLTAARFVKTRHYFVNPGTTKMSGIMHALTVCREELKSQNQYPKLLCPGKYHHMHVLSEVPRQRSSDGSFKWTILEKADAVDFSELCIYKNMWAHHFPHKYERALNRVYKSLKKREAMLADGPLGQESLKTNPQ